MPPQRSPQIQFERAEFGSPVEAVERCGRCARPLDGSRHVFLETSLCEPCAAIIRNALPDDTPRIFWRAVGVGVVVAVALGIIEMVVLLRAGDSAGWLISFGAIGVGWSVGAAMRRAAGGAGGRRYQIAGSVITYLAIMLPLFGALMPLGNGIGIQLLATIAPFVMLLSHRWHLGLLLLFVAYIGVRWTWGLLAGGPRVTQRKSA